MCSVSTAMPLGNLVDLTSSIIGFLKSAQSGRSEGRGSRILPRSKTRRQSDKKKPEIAKVLARSRLSAAIETRALYFHVKK
jgi:hypothetical protein